MVAILLPFLAVAAASAVPSKRADGQQIHLNGDNSKCLSVQNLANGSPVVNVPCNNGWNNAWTIKIGNNDHGVRLAGTNFCLDAGSNPGNFGQAKIWTCYPGLKQQTWWYTEDNLLGLTDGDQCLDVGQSYVQTYECFCDNTNQMWTLTSSTTTPPPPPPSSGTQVHFKGSSTGCLQVGPGSGGEGTSIYINNCADPSYTILLQWQQFELKRNVASVIRLSSNKDLCLDASPSGAWTNGSPIKLQKCNPALQQQQWYYTNDNHLAVVGGNQCLNVKRESVAQQQKPFGTLQDLQTWRCDGPDIQQIFTV